MSLREQCEILKVTRSTLSYQPVETREEDREIMRIMDKIYLKDPGVGSRRLVPLLERDDGIKVNRKRIQRLRREMGIETIWCRPRRTSIPDSGHRKYPYLLGERYNTWRPHQNLGNQTPEQVYTTDRSPEVVLEEMKEAA